MSDKETVLKAHTIEIARGGDSTQPTAVEEDVWRTPSDCIEPPESLERLARLTQISPLRRPCLEALSLNTVGLGYSLVVRDGHEHEVEDATAQAGQLRARLEAAARRDLKLRKPSFTSLMRAVKYDEEETGNGYLEVARDRRDGTISGLFHLPSKRVRRLADRSGYVLLPPDGDVNRGVRFYNFGEKVQYGDGSPLNRLQPGKRWAKNEVIHFALYTSESRDYGLPRDTQNAVDYLGDKLAAESNVSFFDSSGTPPTILFISGQEDKQGARITFRVPDETVLRIGETLRSDAGHRHRVAVVPLPPNTEVKDVKLGEISDRDMGFTEFRGDNAQRTMSSFRLQPIFVGFADEGRYSAEVQRAITLEQVFDPEQTRYEGDLDPLLRDFGFDAFGMNFKRLAVEGDAQRRESTERSAEAGVVTKGEYRDAHGLKRLPEADKADTEIEWNGATYKSAEPEPGQVPFGWNDELIDTGKPKGADARVNEADDQRGLRPGLAGRVSRDKAEGHPRHVEDQAKQLNGRVNARNRRAVERAVERAGAA